MASSRTELKALKNLISEAELILSTTELPQGRAPRCRELLRAALALTDDLIGQERLAPAAVLGRKGGAAVAKRGPKTTLKFEKFLRSKKPAIPKNPR